MPPSLHLATSCYILGARRTYSKFRAFWRGCFEYLTVLCAPVAQSVGAVVGVLLSATSELLNELFNIESLNPGSDRRCLQLRAGFSVDDDQSSGPFE